ncbi:MAG: hypothetical protein IJU48_00370 [Synergistaceae bacterium]|nr:hypothetical protein [Synergistaceae bacterium]
MRKLFVWLMLLVLALTSCAFGAETVYSDFGIYRSVWPDESVIIRPDGVPYYGNIQKFTAGDPFLAFKVSGDDYYSSQAPSGTLIVSSGDARFEGNHYMLTPNWTMTHGSERFYRYYLGGNNLSNLEGSKIFWNLYTSPDITVGNAIVPGEPQERNISTSEIIPYVILNKSADVIQTISVSFVKSGDLTTAVDPEISKVQVVMYGYGWSNRLVNETFTDFSGTKVISVDRLDSDWRNMQVLYEQDGELYTWEFVPYGESVSGIEWGELDLTKQPLTLTSGTSKDITVKLPASLVLEDYDGLYDESGDIIEESIIGITNNNVLALDEGSLIFTQGTGGVWQGLTYTGEEKSTLSFTLLANDPGRTTLAVRLPIGFYYREVNVVSTDGNIVEPAENSQDVNVVVRTHSSQARMLQGKPFYPSAEFKALEFAISGDIVFEAEEESHDVSEGFIGFKHGTTSELYQFTRDDDASSYSITRGVAFDTENVSKDNEFAFPSFLSEDLSGYKFWWETPEGISSPLKSLADEVSFRTTAEQLEDFVPYFEMVYDEEYNAVSLDWSFVNSKTLAKVEPSGVTGININGYDVEGTSGTITLDYYNRSQVNFSYTYNGVRYTWNFADMDNVSYIYGSQLFGAKVDLGASRDMRLILYDIDSLESIDLFVWSTDIISVDPVKFLPDETISFNVQGLKEGYSPLTIMFTRKDINSYDKYTATEPNIRVVSEDEVVVSIASSDLSFDACRYDSRASIIEGVPNYYDKSNELNTRIFLVRKNWLKQDDYYDYWSKLVGVVHVYSGDEEVDSQTLEPETRESKYDEEDGYIVQIEYIIDTKAATRLVWEFNDDMNINNDGSCDIPAVAARSTKTQLETYKPYIKLNRDGLNVSSLEYYFVDAQNNKISTPEGISNIQVKLEAYSYSHSFESEDLSGSGVIPLGFAEVMIENISFKFEENGIKYRWIFEPVDGASPYQWGNNYVISWDIASKDLPLIMYVGDTKEVTLTANSRVKGLKPFLGNTGIATMEVLSSSDHSAKVKLTGLSAGMTTITLAANTFVGWPREIWVAAKNETTGKYEVPNLTDDLETLLEELAVEGERRLWTNHEEEKEISSAYLGVRVSKNPILVSDTTEITLTVSGDTKGTTRRVYIVGYEGDEPKITLSASSITGNGSVNGTFTTNTAGTYSYVAVAGELYESLWIDVIQPSIIVDESTFKEELKEEHTYYTIFTIGGSSSSSKEGSGSGGWLLENTSVDITWELIDHTKSELHTAHSDDLFIVEGIAKLASIDEEQKFIVTATVGSYTASYDIGFTVLSDDAEYTTSGLTVTGAHNDVKAGYKVMFPEGVRIFSEWVDAPLWLEPVYGEYDDYYGDTYVTGVQFVKSIGDLPNGTKATVRVYAEDDENGETGDAHYGWDVVYNAFDPSKDIKPTSPDVKPTSPDVKPTSPDVKPTSPDVKPTSPDVKPTSPDINPDNPVIEPIYRRPQTPTIDVSDTNIITTIINTLRRIVSFITGDTEILDLSSNSSIGTSRELTSSETSQIPEGETTAAVLPPVSVDKPAIYVFSVTLDNLTVGDRIFLRLLVATVANSQNFQLVTTAENDEDAYMFLDDEGNEITEVPEGKTVNVAAYMEPGNVYLPVITTDESNETTSSLGGSGGGCNTGLSVIGLALVGLLISRRKK